MSLPLQQHANTALLLTGGGARAAYQVGVLQAISTWLPQAGNPFPIICGTSAGAINAATLATQALDFRRGTAHLAAMWSELHVSHVYRSDPLGVLAQALRMLAGFALGSRAQHNPASLLDSAPLARLLEEKLNFSGVSQAIEAGQLQALCITAFGYTSAQSVSFYQGAPHLEGWQRARRVGLSTNITIAHLLASSAIPFVFPAARIHREYFGDGSMRQSAPISPALHLGANRVMIVSAGRHTQQQPQRVTVDSYPSFAQIAGHALSCIFLDNIETDLERLQRINRTVSLIAPEVRRRNDVNLHHVDCLMIAPSEDLDKIAMRHAQSLPRTVRVLLAGIGALRRSGSNLLSYLLFEQAFCRELIELGQRDAQAQKTAILGFLQADASQPVLAPVPRAEPQETVAA